MLIHRKLYIVKSCLTAVCAVIYLSSHAQATTDNYIKVYKAQVPLTGDISAINSKDSVSESIVYYDGLGRELQSVGRQASPAGYDVVTFAVYDEYGKRTISHLPYVSSQTNGQLKSTPLPDQTQFYQNLFGQADGTAALSDQILEHSELSRLLKQGAPGETWQVSGTHAIEKQYLLNGASEVLNFSYNFTTGEIALTSGQSHYLTNTLFCNKTIDEHQNDVLEYVDKEGRTVCKKVKVSGSQYASTYYLYDLFGSLVVVLPPEAIARIVNP